jgi:bis(5'-nucleosyl)-tetraphosphatase (symmetrical)
MSLYLIGDVQGCDGALARLLERLDFSPSRDTLYLLGDLVNRGPASDAVLRRLQGYGDAARCLLGNHDLGLLTVAAGFRQPKPGDTVQAVLEAPDREALLEWLCHQPLVRLEYGVLMVHAGVLPQWEVPQVLALADEVHAQLRGPGLRDFLAGLFGNEPDRWDDRLQGPDRWRVIVNALTRMRFCTPEGQMDVKTSGGPDRAPVGMTPWFDAPGRRTAGQTIACGHWSTLGVRLRPDLLALDSGCVWGGCLSALRLGPTPASHELIQVDCEAAQIPGNE